ncbi:single-stranded DNA-binding protein [Microbacterium sp. NRRL B-14842]|uniref:single-stranded DNA-binding protein n=1 Tax=Microbacterium sp. NRRL B-14842 TaxID=3162881 RepID=UPI003D26F018
MRGTNWFSIAAFRQLAEHARASLRVGDSVIVSGRLRVRPWGEQWQAGDERRHRRRHDRTRSAVGDHRVPTEHPSVSHGCGGERGRPDDR